MFYCAIFYDDDFSVLTAVQVISVALMELTMLIVVTTAEKDNIVARTMQTMLTAAKMMARDLSVVRMAPTTRTAVKTAAKV